MKMYKCGSNKSHFWWHLCPCTCIIIYLLDFCYQEGTHPVLYGRGKYPHPPPQKCPLLFPLSKKPNIYYQATVLYTEYVSNSFLFALYIS